MEARASMTPAFLIFLGAILLFAWWIASRQAVIGQMLATQAPSGLQDGNWTTPYYLRGNIPVASTQQAIMPAVAADNDPNVGFSLATFYQPNP